MRNDPDISEMPKEPKSFVGIIVPIEWDENGNPLAIAIATESEQVYRIKTTRGKGSGLRKLLRKRVSISGIVSFSKTGQSVPVITGISFKRLSDLPRSKHWLKDIPA
jgi:hypothetical protein